MDPTNPQKLEFCLWIQCRNKIWTEHGVSGSNKRRSNDTATRRCEGHSIRCA